MATGVLLRGRLKPSDEKSNPTLRELITETALTRYLLTDGGISTALQAAGADAAVPVELLNLQNPDLVTAIHQAYCDAGADCMTTNTFGAVPAAGASGSSLSEICKAGAELARAVAGPSRYVLGSLGVVPSEHQAPTPEEWRAAAGALMAGGVDAFTLETVSDTAPLAHILPLLREAAPGVPVIVSLAFERRATGAFHLASSGESLQEALVATLAVQPDGIGANCGKGVDGYEMSTIIAAMRASFEGLIIARPSAGEPRQTATGLEFHAGPDMMTDTIWGLIRAGANLIGGCCGASPEHIAAFRPELDMLT